MYISRKKRQRTKLSDTFPVLSTLESTESKEQSTATPNSETREAPIMRETAPPEAVDNTPSAAEESILPATEPSTEPETEQTAEMPVELIAGEDREMLEEPQENISANYSEFLSQNPATGILKIQAFIGRQGLPVPGASVTVSKRLGDGEKELYSVVTDSDGIVDGLILPAPERAASQVPGNGNPYATYTVKAMHPNFLTAVYERVPIFAGVKSIQPIAFIPRPEAEG